MKKLLFILSLVFLICFGSAVHAFETGDVIDGVKLTISESDSNYSYVKKSKFWLKNVTFGYIFMSDGPILSSDLHLRKSDSASFIIMVDKSGASVSSVNSSYYCQGGIASANHDIYDYNGKLVFPPPPEVAPVPEVVTLEIVPQAMTANLKILLPLGLVALAILLGVRLVPRLVGLFLR